MCGKYVHTLRKTCVKAVGLLSHMWGERITTRYISRISRWLSAFHSQVIRIVFHMYSYVISRGGYELYTLSTAPIITTTKGKK